MKQTHPDRLKYLKTKRALDAALEAADAAGRLLRRHRHAPKRINSEARHDIKLELDVRSQKLIEKLLRRAGPEIPVLGEEGSTGSAGSSHRWVIDPIDGTVNFAHGIPHACISIALQERRPHPASGTPSRPPGVRDDDAGYETVAGVVCDPFADEWWSAIRGGPARLNGRVIRVSDRARLGQCIVSLGFAKSSATRNHSLAIFNRLIHRVRKVRIMGAAALGLVYVASGRFDAYLETGLRLWDIAAGGLILECAGGNFFREQIRGAHTYRVVASNQAIRRHLRVEVNAALASRT